MKRALALALILASFMVSALAEGNPYRDLLLAEDYGDAVTVVIGHRNPDADTVGSAMAYAYLLNAIGIPAEAAISGPVNNETACALNALGIQPPGIVDLAEGKQFVLVDHSAYSQAIDGMESARIVGIVDHHGIGDVRNNELINVRSAPVGATASLVFLAYRECEVEIPRDMARAMLMSVLSDTRNLKKNVTAIDRSAFEALVDIADIGDVDALYRAMAVASSAYEGMTEEEIFQSDYKEYDEAGYHFGIASVDALGEDAVRDMADLMYGVMWEYYWTGDYDMLFAMVKNKGEDEGENSMYMVAVGAWADEALEAAFGCYDGSRYHVFKDDLSRKKDVVPALTAVLNGRR